MAWPHWVCLQGSRGRGVPAVIVAMMTWPRLKIIIVENYYMWHVIWLQWISSWQCCFSTFFFFLLMFQSDMFLPLLLPNQPDTVTNNHCIPCRMIVTCMMYLCWFRFQDIYYYWQIKTNLTWYVTIARDVSHPIVLLVIVHLALCHYQICSTYSSNQLSILSWKSYTTNLKDFKTIWSSGRKVEIFGSGSTSMKLIWNGKS